MSSAGGLVKWLFLPSTYVTLNGLTLHGIIIVPFSFNTFNIISRCVGKCILPLSSTPLALTLTHSIGVNATSTILSQKISPIFLSL
jgi:hypothetical protein